MKRAAAGAVIVAATVAMLLGITLAPRSQAHWLAIWHASQAASLPAGSSVRRDIAYGGDPAQRLDLYRPAGADRAPLILLVHGGGWRRGGRDNPGLAAPKATHWLPMGYALASVDYRLLPDADPLQQAHDVAQALAYAQHQAETWGIDPTKVILVGHSAGAHLVTLLASDPALLQQAGALPPRVVVALDSAALNVPAIMESAHPPLYDAAFGEDPAHWRAMSPLHQLTRAAPPMLLVCSTRRAVSCAQADAFATAAQDRGIRAEVLMQDLSHMQINRELGAANRYTAQVDAFITALLEH